MMPPTKERLQRYYRQALDRCLDAFRSLSDGEWARKSTQNWTAKDYLAHLVSSQEEEGNRLTAQALAGQPGQLPGFIDREHSNDYNEGIQAPLRDLPVGELGERFRKVYEGHLAMLDTLSEADLDKPASNPGWDRPGTVRDLFYMGYLHLPHHYQDIRRAVKRLPHWMDACPPDEINYQLGRTFHYMPLIYWRQRGGDLKATFLFTIEGEGGGQWAIRIGDGRAETQEGAPEKVDAEVRTKPALWMDLVSKDLNAAMAIMTRKLHISGNLALALRLESLFQVT